MQRLMPAGMPYDACFGDDIYGMTLLMPPFQLIDVDARYDAADADTCCQPLRCCDAARRLLMMPARYC